MNASQSIANLQTQLSLLEGNLCWSVIAGESTGSQLKCDFGARIPRRKAIHNSKLSRDQQVYEGEFDLFIECAWRLEEGTEVVCGSTDNNRNSGPMRTGLGRLHGQTVVEASVASPIPDLILGSLTNFC